MRGWALRLGRALGRFGRDGSGSATIQFVLSLAFVFGFLLISLDTAFNTMRAGLLDRAVDITARNIRNGTLANPTLANIRTDLCSRMTFFNGCATQLKIEITSVNRATFAMPSPTSACADSGAGITPVRRFVAGQANGVAVLRACMEIPTLIISPTLIGRPALYRLNASTVIAGTAS